MGQSKKKKRQPHIQSFSARRSKLDNVDTFMPQAETELKGPLPRTRLSGWTPAPASKPSPLRPPLSQTSSRSEVMGQEGGARFVFCIMKLSKGREMELVCLVLQKLIS